jgi:hypothetical protein
MMNLPSAAVSAIAPVPMLIAAKVVLAVEADTVDEAEAVKKEHRSEYFKKL